ncbi:MAG: RHS repeat-associated core domain-containing protein [Bryobacterales bacterium]|nr:RHS repeat-associated core domain-containing protein [Bryobacterales bacterium]
MSKTVGGVTTRYLVDQLTPTGYAQVAEELVGGAVARRYTHGAFRHSQTQLISGNWTTHYYGYDGGLHVTRLTDITGAVSDSYTYDAYGNLTAASGATPNVFLYRGEQYDASVQMYYLRARWYVPATARFLTLDTVELDGGGKRLCLAACSSYPDMRLNHLYGYAGADPVNFADPSGHLRVYLRLSSSAVGWASELRTQAYTAVRIICYAVALVRISIAPIQLFAVGSIPVPPVGDVISWMCAGLTLTNPPW